MSKVICDICGTTYPETADRCPICGCAKTGAAQTQAGEPAQSGESTYTYVKGGRFSKANVRKQNRGVETPRRSAPAKAEKPVKQDKEPNKTNKILAVIIVILLLAIVAVLIYMVAKVFLPGSSGDAPKESTSASEMTEPSESQAPSGPQRIPCVSVAVSQKTITFLSAGDGYLLTATVLPADTTDSITFASSNDGVVTVTDSGRIEAVGGGSAIIYVTCGDVTQQCEIICNFGDYVEPTESQPTEPSVGVPEGYVLKLKYTEFTMSTKYPNPVNIFAKNNFGVKATDITWTSDDPKIATVDENGTVSAVGKGNTVIRASIGEQTASCQVIVAFEPKPATEPKYKLSHTDVRLYVGDAKEGSFRISLTDKEGVNVDAEWVASEEGYVTINNRNITAVKNTQALKNRYITVSATVDGETYTCIVRIYDKPEES